jgi:DNA-binding NarL/FixJ family response regulator
MKVVIIDHHVLFRQGLSSLLNKDPDFDVIGEFDSVDFAMEKITLLHPDLVILDIAFQEGYGLEIIKETISHNPETRIIILTASIDDSLLFGVIRAGASGCLLKSTPISKLLVALRALQCGEMPYTRSMFSSILKEFRRISDHQFHPPIEGLENLTSREMDTLIAMGEDPSDEYIAQRLMISENTAKVHVQNIKKKLHLKNRQEANLLARSLGPSNLLRALPGEDSK